MNKKNILIVLIMIMGSMYAQDTTMENKSAKHSWWQTIFSKKAKLDQRTFENKFDEMENILQAHLDAFINTLQNIDADEKSIGRSQESIAQTEEQIKQMVQGPEKEKALRAVSDGKKTIEEGLKKLKIIKEKLNHSKEVIEKSVQELEHIEDELTEAIWEEVPEEDIQAQKAARKRVTAITLPRELKGSYSLQED